jgi:response regulator RpfG family c-di-GMP phosphodiesterase
VAVAERLGLDDDAVAVVGQAALLHDIGKVAAPDAVLHKRGLASRPGQTKNEPLDRKQVQGA